MNKQIKKKSISGFLGLDTSGIFGVLLAIYWTSGNVVYFLNGLMERLFGETAAELFIPSLFIIFGLLSLPHVCKKIKWYDVLFFIIVVVYFNACYRLYPNTAPFLEAVKPRFLYYALPAIFVGLSLDYIKCARILYVASFTAVILTTLSTLMGGGTMAETDEDLARAYFVLAPSLYIVFRYFLYKKEIDLVVSAIGLVHLFSLGARGPLLCYMSFVILYLVFFKEYKKPLLIRSLLLSFLILSYVFLEPIMALLSDFSVGIGLSSRVSDFYFSGNIMDGKGRDLIYANVFASTVNGPFWGGGFCADRLYSDFFDRDTYAHNLVLELWAEFGLLGGSIIVLAILISFILALIKSRNDEERGFMLLMFVSGIGSLLFSDSYLFSNLFFMTVGLFVAYARRDNKKITNLKRFRNLWNWK